MPAYTGPLQTVVESHTLWLVVLLPLLGAVLNAAVGWKLQRSSFGKALSQKLHIGSLSVSSIAIGAMVASFSLAVWHVVTLMRLPVEHRTLLNVLWPMVRVGSFDLSFALSLDQLSAVMLLVVTGIGLLIHVYATAYMQTEPSYWRFFSYLNLFIFSMLLLILGDNFVVMFFGWEGVGLCSYLLIGFWYRDYKKASAGTKAFLTNRVGDFGFIAGMATLFWALGGTWTSSGYVPDQEPRLVPVVIEQGADGHGAHGTADTAHGHAAATGDGLLTFTAFPGAQVFIDGNRAEPVTVPFVRKPISAGRHTFEVVMGGATDDLIVQHAIIPAGKETMLTPVGPVLTFRDVHNQLQIREASTGAQPYQNNLAGKSLFGISVITLACLGFFLGATGKSAQIPLYVWLPDAMAGPTPVSALIHAATMVTSGVYMVARLNFLYSLSPTASGVVACVGALTALFAASIGFFQYDIKKVLAYSTVSQLGFMFIGVGVGAYAAGIFHVMTHAFFKACLFLGSGSVIHGMHAVEHDADLAQDMRIMGGLKKQMPLTRWTYLIACLAITAAPIPLFAGFWSKDEILWRAFTTQNTGWMPGWLLYVMGLVAAVGTSFYMWRSYYLTFEGKPARKDIPDKVHESPPTMTYVLVALAFLSTIGGALFGFSTHYVGLHEGQPGYFAPLLEHWLHPVMRNARVFWDSPAVATLLKEHALMWTSVALAIGAWALARKRYGASRPDNWEALEQKTPGFRLLHNKYYVDEIYQGTVIRAVLQLRLALRDMDRWVIDGIVNGVAMACRVVSFINNLIDKYLVDGAVNLVAESTLRIGNRLRRVQTGRIQNYGYGILGGVATIAIVMFLVRYYGSR